MSQDRSEETGAGVGSEPSEGASEEQSKERHESRLARWAARGKPGSPPVPAATVVLIRDGRDGLETLMLRRNSKIAFGGMWVFPGGRVDPEDLDPTRLLDDEAAARRAAVREAREEAGLEIALAELVPYSHWTPPPITPKRFLTWFFVAAAPSTRVVIDGGEIHEHAWMRPAEALLQRDRAAIELAPPTWVTLHELSRHAASQDVLAAARGRTPERFETHIGVEAAGPTAMWHGDAGWDESDPARPGARHRLSMHGGTWRYERGG